jgi:hypothetical protein
MFLVDKVRRHFNSDRSQVEPEHKSEQQLNIQHADPEILWEIFKQIEPIELIITVRHVCKNWRWTVERKDLEDDLTVMIFRAIIQISQEEDNDQNLVFISRFVDKRNFLYPEVEETPIEQCLSTVAYLSNSLPPPDQRELTPILVASKEQFFKKSANKGNAFALSILFLVNLATTDSKSEELFNQNIKNGFLKTRKRRLKIASLLSLALPFKKKDTKSEQKLNLMETKIEYAHWKKMNTPEANMKALPLLKKLVEAKIPYFQALNAELLLNAKDKEYYNNALELLLQAKYNPKAQFLLGRLFGDFKDKLGTDAHEESILYYLKGLGKTVDLNWFEELSSAEEEALHFCIGRRSIALEGSALEELNVYKNSLDAHISTLFKTLSEMYKTGYILSKNLKKSKYYELKWNLPDRSNAFTLE